MIPPTEDGDVSADVLRIAIKHVSLYEPAVELVSKTNASILFAEDPEDGEYPCIQEHTGAPVAFAGHGTITQAPPQTVSFIKIEGLPEKPLLQLQFGAPLAFAGQASVVQLD